jgi:U3 small nucleolar RNA-associated protein 14
MIVNVAAAVGFVAMIHVSLDLEKKKRELARTATRVTHKNDANVLWRRKIER